MAPNVKTWAEATFASQAAGLYLLAGTTLLGAVLILAIGQAKAIPVPSKAKRA